MSRVKTREVQEPVFQLAPQDSGGKQDKPGDLNRDAEGVEGVRNGEGYPLPIRLGGLGERRKLSQRGPVRSPGQKRF